MSEYELNPNGLRELYTTDQKEKAITQLERDMVEQEINDIIERLSQVPNKMDDTWEARMHILGDLRKFSHRLKSFEDTFFGQVSAWLSKKAK